MMTAPPAPVPHTGGERRIASLDLLRGVAALSVAIPHYVMLGSGDWPAATVVSILAVEVFFVLSGYVLAPQLLQCLVSPRASDTGIFLMRRWMRTVPPYLVALIAVTLITGNFYSGDLKYYALYIQNLFWPLPEARDYFAVAWSLSVEEWFYIVFAAIVALARLARLGERGLLATAVCFIAVISLARLVFGDYSHWDANVRRVFVFRADSITFGFVLYCLQDRLTAAMDSTSSRRAVLLLAMASAPAAFAAGWYATAGNMRLAQHLYPFAAAWFGASVIFLLFHYRNAFQRPPAFAELSYFAGKVSYTIYLFHIIAILLLRPHLASLPLFAQLAVYSAVLILWCWIFYNGFEAPILAARPRYPKVGEKQESFANRFPNAFSTVTAGISNRGKADWLRLAAILALATAAFAGVERLQESRNSIYFYAALLAAAVAIVALFAETGLWRVALARVVALTGLLVAIFLPVADYIFLRLQTKETAQVVRPVYSYAEAKGNPDAFRAWWARYTDEWRNGAQAAIEVPDPQGQLPFVHRPNARSTFFKAEVRINNLGFRGPDIARDKGNRFRIVALGESPTFGTMIEAGDTAWPRVLQSLIETKLVCAHPVEVVNAGVPGYSLVQNIVRMRRSIAPLKPDIVVSYHGFNGLPLIDPVLGEMPAPPIYKRRASPLLAAFRFNMRLSKYAAERKAFGDAGEQTQFSNRYGELYDELAAESKRAGARLFIANMSTAVTGDSPKEVKEFYGRVFSPIDRIVAAIAEHNRLAQAAAARNGAAFIDTRGGLSGAWDRDLFIDLVHFTQKGSDLLAQKVYAALEPSLLAAPVPGCRVRESARND